MPEGSEEIETTRFSRRLGVVHRRVLSHPGDTADGATSLLPPFAGLLPPFAGLLSPFTGLMNAGIAPGSATPPDLSHLALHRLFGGALGGNPADERRGESGEGSSVRTASEVLDASGEPTVIQVLRTGTEGGDSGDRSRGSIEDAASELEGSIGTVEPREPSVTVRRIEVTRPQSGSVGGSALVDSRRAGRGIDGADDSRFSASATGLPTDTRARTHVQRARPERSDPDLETPSPRTGRIRDAISNEGRVDGAPEVRDTDSRPTTGSEPERPGGPNATADGQSGLTHPPGGPPNDATLAAAVSDDSVTTERIRRYRDGPVLPAPRSETDAPGDRWGGGITERGGVADESSRDECATNGNRGGVVTARGAALTYRRPRAGDEEMTRGGSVGRGGPPAGSDDEGRVGAGNVASAPTETPPVDLAVDGPTVDRLVDRLYRGLERKMRVERERRGR